MAEQPRTPDEEILQAQSPRTADLHGDPERLERIQAELQKGFELLDDVSYAISMFGSARVREGDADYELARTIARKLAEAGMAIITGGGPGVMEASNRGAKEGGSLSIGLNIDSPFDKHENPSLAREMPCHYFFTRKLFFVRYAIGFVVLPGGFGTLDEMFEALTLSQTDKIRHFPVVLVGKDYWGGLVDWIRARLLEEGKISHGDMDLFRICDDPKDVVSAVFRGAEAQGFPAHP